MAPAALESPKAAIYGSSQYTPLGEPSKDLSSRSRTSNPLFKKPGGAENEPQPLGERWEAEPPRGCHESCDDPGARVIGTTAWVSALETAKPEDRWPRVVE